MSATPKLFARGAIPTTDTTVYTVPDGVSGMVKDFDICNTTGSDLTVSVYLIPSGESVADESLLVPNVTIPANSMLQWTGTQLMDSGDFVSVIASADGCNLRMSGIES